MDKFIGIDLHSNNSVVVVSDEEDRVIFQKRIPAMTCPSCYITIPGAHQVE